MLLVAGGVALVIAVVVSARALDVQARALTWWPILVALCLASPVTIGLNAAELRVSTAIVHPDGRRMPWPTAFRTVIAATGANLLPLPAGALLRIEAVRRTGVGVVPATNVNLVAAALWVTAGVGIAAIAAVARHPVAASVGLLGAATGLAAATMLARRIATGRWSRTFLLLGGIEAATALFHGVRLWLALQALGIAASVRQALIMGAAGPLSAAAGVFPSGIGLAEGLTALLAPLATLPPAAGVLATALSRIIGLSATVLVAIPLGVGSIRDNIGAARRRAAAVTEEERCTDPIEPPGTGSASS